MPTFKINGTENSSNITTNNALFKVEASYLVSNNRATGSEIDVDYDKDEIAHLIFDDGVEWIGNIEDVKEIFPVAQGQRSTASDNELFPSMLTSSSGKRAGIGAIALKVFSRYKADIPKAAADFLAEYIDNKLMPKPGMYSVNEAFEIKEITSPLKSTGKYLLLLHGTISDTNGSFEGLKNNVWAGIYGKYDGVLALEHHTLSQSPMVNALDVLTFLPNGVKIDIISHSRGGLIADALTRCDRRNGLPAYSQMEIDIFKKGDN